MTGLFQLGKSDFIKGAIVAVFAAALTVLVGTVGTHGFDVFSADWIDIGRNIVNVSASAFVAYLAKNFLTDSKGNVAGVIKAE